MCFSDLPINTTEIQQSLLNIENKTRSNLFAWNGQFSPQFVETILSKYAKSDFLVVDPFLGSGTVLYECARKDIRAYGMELNTSAYLMAKTYELSNLPYISRIELASKIETILYGIVDESSIIDVINSTVSSTTDVNIKNILSTLIILLDIFNNHVTFEILKNKWSSLKDIILSLPYADSSIIAENGDARCLSLDDNEADMILTSPPYINVFNYHQKYRASVESLGYNVLSIAKSEFGSNRKNRSNRLLTVIQYCIDMALSLKEANRVCKPDARLIYVVGRESTVLGYSICNSQLVYELGTEIFGMPFVTRQERVFKNRYGQNIYEDILHFSNSDSRKLCNNDIIEGAIAIAIRMLESKYNIENKNRSLLIDAISNAYRVKESEVYKNA